MTDSFTKFHTLLSVGRLFRVIIAALIVKIAKSFLVDKFCNDRLDGTKSWRIKGPVQHFSSVFS